MGISLFKILLSSQMLLSGVATTGVAVNEFNRSSLNSQVSEMTQLIASKSKVIGTKEIYNFNGETFNSKQELDNFIYSESLIQSYQTSSNLNEIIKDHQNGILDETKLYDTNLDNFSMVYRDAFGNAQTQRQKALDSYTNLGLVQQRYSYDHIGWYDSPTEAKDNFVFKQGLEKSNYYQVNGRFYNAFNKDDQEKMLNGFVDGYYLKPSNFVGTKRAIGNADNIEKTIKNNFASKWGSPTRVTKTEDICDDLNYVDFVETSTQQTFKFYKSEKIEMHHYIEGREQKHNGQVTIKPKDRLDGGTDFFRNKNNYDRGLTHGSWNGKKWLYKYGFINSDGQKEEITFNTTKDGSWGKNPTDVDLSKLIIDLTHNSAIKLYGKKIDEMKDSEKDAYLIRTKSNLGYEIASTKDIPTEIVLELFDYWLPVFVKNEILNTYGLPREKYNKYGVKRDYLYGPNGVKGEELSVSDSQEYYDNVLKPEIMTRYDGFDQEGNQLYKVNSQLSVTKADLDNYLYLMGEMDVRTLYTFTGEKHQSSLDGLLLSPTSAEAQEKLFQIESNVLAKKYFAFDVYGNYEVSGNDKEDAVRKLQTKIDLSSKYVHNDEIKSWKNKTVSFDNIITDGIYTTYKVMINDKPMYFINQMDAYDALVSGSYGGSVVTSEVSNVYLYIQNKDGEYIEHTYSTPQELEQIALKVLGYAH
ncbi:hypothetical protein [Spiroplasma alleghenense]|uniref:Uncharacterized protein n=1 Tax=Spiroplasma alleghenense TaxID=216931 RepID=A0A345Z506_9MOLU|nr:hypothetical protein [Spiroplasma alleghenense]AXK51685.1 hypothetical protein SALLE_v1c10150 [Spiroplasma alleghenense]